MKIKRTKTLKFLIILFAFCFIAQQIPFVGITNAFASHASRGQTEPEEDDEEEQCDKEPKECCKGDADPVYLYSGEFYYTHVDLELPGKIPIRIKRNYSSFSVYNLEFGYGWIMNYDYKLYRQHDGNLLLRRGCNDRDVFNNNGDGTFSSPENEYETITANPDGTYTLERKDTMKYQFDINGCLSSIDDLNGNQLIFTYDPAGKLPVNGISPFSNIETPIVVAYAYRLVRIEQYTGGVPTGRYVEFRYNDNGRIINIQDHAGREIFYIYDVSENGDLVTFMDAEGNSYNYTYNNHLIEEFEGMGCSDCSLYVNEYDSDNRVIRQTHGNSIIEFAYPIPKQKTEVTHKVYNDTTGEFLREYTEISEFDEYRNRTKHTIQYGDETIVRQNEFYASRNLIKKRTDPMGNITDYRYGDNVTETTTLITGGRLTKTYTYNDLNKKESEEISASWDPQTYRTEYTYYDNGNLKEVKRILDDTTTYTTTYTYTAEGNIDIVTDPLGNRIKYEYNDYGMPTREYDPDNPVRQTRYTYDGYGNRRSITDANNKTTTFGYDNINRLTSITNHLNQQTIYTYTGPNITRIEQGKTETAPGHITRIQYDEMNRKTAVIKETSEGDITIARYTYDSEGNVLSVTDANSNTTNYTYDTIGRLYRVTDPMGNPTTYAYDDLNNLTGITDAEENITTYGYDGLSRLTTVTQPEVDGVNPTTTYTYNALGNVKTITDAEGHTTTNTYDRLGRLKQIEDPLTHITQYFYDANNNLDYKIDANGATVDYDYNDYSELRTITYPDYTVSFGYDNAGNLTSYGDGITSATYVPDDLNRIEDVILTYPFGVKTVSYTYDRFGNRETATYPDTGTLTYHYDDMDRLKRIEHSGSDIVTYGYDDASRLDPKTLANGTVTTYTFDNANRLRSVIASDSEAISYTHDNVGNRLTRTDSDGEHVYGYDDLYRLTLSDHPEDIVDEDYTYDKVGNRKTNADYADWMYNAGNQLDSYNSTTFTYDNNGNTRTKTDTGGETTYVWDYENRLASATTPTNSTSYYYDPFGKRLYKWVDGVATWYLYDHEDIVAEYDNDGNLLRSYIHGPGIDEPIRMTGHTGDTPTNYYYLADGLGSIIQIQDESGATVETYGYDSFGNPTILSPDDVVLDESAVGNFYLYTAREWDREIGLYCYRYRYYDPILGRFLSEDPIGFSGDDTNFYTYVGANPLRFIDPFGLWKKRYRRTVWQYQVYERTMYICKDLEDKCKCDPDHANPTWQPLNPRKFGKLAKTIEEEMVEWSFMSNEDALMCYYTGTWICPETGYDYEIKVISEKSHEHSAQRDEFFKCTCEMAKIEAQRIEERRVQEFFYKESDWKETY